jgi:hypothetical protein
LEEEVRQLAVKAPPGVGPEWKQIAKRLWKDETMNEILMQIREQQATMALLVQTLQMYGCNRTTWWQTLTATGNPCRQATIS